MNKPDEKTERLKLEALALRHVLTLPEGDRAEAATKLYAATVALMRMALRQAPLVIGAVAVSVADDPHLVPGFGQ